MNNNMIYSYIFNLIIYCTTGQNTRKSRRDEGAHIQHIPGRESSAASALPLTADLLYSALSAASVLPLTAGLLYSALSAASALPLTAGLLYSALNAASVLPLTAGLPYSALTAASALPLTAGLLYSTVRCHASGDGVPANYAAFVGGHYSANHTS